ncbi:MAG TPA: hypothetical protein VF611_03220 [Pyrinomonadaceae bacterium]
MERTIQFILEQQAQLTVNHAKAEERMTRVEEAQESLARTQENLARSQENLARSQEDLGRSQGNTARQIEHLGVALIELTEAHTRTQGALTRLAEAQTHSDQRLDALIDIVRGGKGTGQ